MIYAVIILSCLLAFFAFVAVVCFLNFRVYFLESEGVRVDYYGLCKMLSTSRRAREAMQDSEEAS